MMMRFVSLRKENARVYMTVERSLFFGIIKRRRTYFMNPMFSPAMRLWIPVDSYIPADLKMEEKLNKLYAKNK